MAFRKLCQVQDRQERDSVSMLISIALYTRGSPNADFLQTDCPEHLGGEGQIIRNVGCCCWPDKLCYSLNSAEFTPEQINNLKRATSKKGIKKFRKLGRLKNSDKASETC